jgi:protein-tyrosine-phosphatase
MAAAFYNRLSGSHDADSAGTEVELPGETLLDRRNRLGGTVAIELLQQEGIDISHNQKTQLKPEMLGRYDHVISMANSQVTPDWLKDANNYTFWPIKDPGATDIVKAAEARDEIKAKVEELIALHA